MSARKRASLGALLSFTLLVVLGLLLGGMVELVDAFEDQPLVIGVVLVLGLTAMTVVGGWAFFAAIYSSDEMAIHSRSHPRRDR